MFLREIVVRTDHTRHNATDRWGDAKEMCYALWFNEFVLHSRFHVSSHCRIETGANAPELCAE